MEWNNKKPIYQQIQDRITEQIIDGVIKENSMLPSIRQLSMDLQINPITVSKAYAGLVEQDIIDKKRGLGMEVKPGARQQLLRAEKQKFLQEEWPNLKNKLKRLDIKPEDLLHD